VEQVPEDDFHLPIGKAEVLIPGSDLTVLTWGAPVYNADNAIEFLRNPPQAIESLVPPSLRSAKIELIDLRSILPWDVETVVESVKKTGRLVIVHEAGMTAGAGAEISAEVQKRCFLKLSAPVKRVTGWEYVLCLFPRSAVADALCCSIPNALQYEKFHIPDSIRILDAIMETLSY